jgi:hypothetical protein
LLIDAENTIVGNETLRQYSGDQAILNTLLSQIHLALSHKRKVAQAKSRTSEKWNEHLESE